MITFIHKKKLISREENIYVKAEIKHTFTK